MKIKILANDGIDSEGKALLENAGFEVITEKVAQEDLVRAINENNYTALTVRSATKVRKELIDACPGLKLVGRGGVGMDNIDVEYALSKGISVINTPAASSGSVAELVIAHLFSMVRFLYDANRHMPVEGDVKFNDLKKKYANGIELRGKTLGIVGFGRIGQAVAKYAMGIGMKVLPFDPMIESAQIIVDFCEGAPFKIPTVPLEEVLRNSDFITFHVPGGEVVTEKELDMMKKGIGLVNTARGGVINEKALVNALNSGKVAYAALDVFENEPTPDKALLSHPNISLTPHIGAATIEAQARIGIELAEKIIGRLKD